jgi:hypothetical protein
MGSSVGAPHDEYDDGAVDLIRALNHRSPGTPVEKTVRTLWPNASDRLVAEVSEAWARYATPTLADGFPEA